MSEKRLFNNEWLFTKQELGQTLEDIHASKTVWKEVDLPHDWLIYQVNDLYETSEGWYKRILTSSDLMDGQRYSLRFEGVYMNSTLFINDTVVGEWKYGYSTFEFDITDYLTKEENEILVRVVHESPNSRWYSGAGIYRNVWLKSYPDVHLASDGIYISTEKKDTSSWNLLVTTEITGSTAADHNNYQIRHSVYPALGDDTDLLIVHSVASVVHQDDVTICDQAMQVESPRLWDITSPNLYILKTELVHNEQVIETEYNRFGFRTMEFTKDQGFFLNGRHVKINGSCEHHDLGCLGAAMNKTALKRELTLLMSMGVNAIRTSHNMPAVELMELADELGLLIDSEGFDMWERSKTTYDYARYFKDWVDKDVASWIRRDRNHPSIILWSVGNEIYDTHSDEHGQEITNRLRNLVRTYDYRKNAPVTIGSNYMAWENAQKCGELIDVVGYNYGEYLYEEHHKTHPKWKMYGSETASTVQSRGIYRFPYSQPVLNDEDEQCSCLGNCTTSWGAKNSEYCITADRDANYSAGQFIWTGFDYIGEPTPYFTKNSYFGQIDTAGFPKDTFYLYQAEWTNYKIAPMVHIFPYWDFNEGQHVDVRVCSNAPKVELFLNDVSLGTNEIDHVHGTKLTGDYVIPYQPGCLKAVAYDEDNNIIATDEQHSFKDAANIVLSADKDALFADGKDLIFIEISTTDDENHIVQNANNRMEVTVTGEGRLIGLDNGDSTDYDEYKATSKRLFSGRLLAVIASTLVPGEIKVTVSSIGLKEKTMIFKSIKSCETGISALTSNQSSKPNSEVPIRKLEIVAPNGTHLDEAMPTTEAYVKIYPANATYDDIEWRITNESGIDSNIASIKVDHNKVTITALGSGNAMLRCTCKNGKDKVNMISQLDFTFTGLGDAMLNPYEFVYGGLYNASNRELSNGIEHGVSAPTDEISYIGFRNLDFGPYGSDEITVPVYSLGNDPVTLAIYKGMPDEEGSELLVDAVYDKPPIWMTYQPVTYRFKERIKGLATICFVIQSRISIKGFQFTKQNKALSQLAIKDYDAIYGDTFTIAEDAITGIGNNVALEYTDMDFGTDGITQLTICGHSPIERNTIHVRFKGEDGNSQQIAEFLYSNDYEERTFDLTKVVGKQNVTLLFLPGSNFDLKWIQFK